jgi:hypothetical protein
MRRWNALNGVRQAHCCLEHHDGDDGSRKGENLPQKAARITPSAQLYADSQMSLRKRPLSQKLGNTVIPLRLEREGELVVALLLQPSRGEGGLAT